MRTFFEKLCAVLVTGFIWAGCGGPQELPPDFWNPNQSNQNSNNNNNQNNLNNNNICSVGAPGNDCDGDGLTDECERKLGMNPCDSKGIINKPEGFGNFTPEEQSFWRSLAYSALEPNLMVGSSAFNKNAPGGTQVIVRRQLLRIGNGSNERVPEAILNFCDSRNQGFVYILISGTVCETFSDPNSGCKEPTRPAAIELCATNPSFEDVDPSQLTQKKSKLVIPDLNWTIGRADGITLFDPGVLSADGSKAQTSLTIRVDETRALNNQKYVNKIHTTWESSWPLYANLQDLEGRVQGTIQASHLKINKNWKRIAQPDPNLIPQGILRLFTND